ncbi:hypothetical protein PV325_004208 [Microctonus aethiopoides]|nr:hypothetical protein PV325_004208 [Microctonus aethiopoides]
MSQSDYEQITHDHAALLVLLKSVGTQIKQNVLSRLFDRIGRNVSKFEVVDSGGVTREIFIRFVKEYSVENVEWGDFQTHRRLLGLITFGKYDNQMELNELCRLHETLKVKYNATLYDSRAILFGSTETNNINEPPNGLTTPSNFKTVAAFFKDETCPSLETQVMECLRSLFWILEAKRLEKTREKSVTLLRAPFEKKELIGVDLESRNNKKRCSGRMIKHLADLCLQAGLYADALNYYNIAASNLQSVNDWLWLGASYEGLCAASALKLYPNLRRNLPLQRNSSLQEGSPGKQRRESQCLTGQSLPSSTDVQADISHILSSEEISKKYKEAIVHYSKYQNAGIIEIEASFKAARVSIEQNSFLQAASFLNNVVFNNININEQEKIERFTKLSELYHSFGFNRKASFCMRLAATRYVSLSNPRPDWKQCYNVMLQATTGFKLSLDPADMTCKNPKGWPAIQIQIIHELIAAANRMGNLTLATRHLTFLLQSLFNYLTRTERQEIALQLQSIAQQCEGAPVPLVLQSGIVIPPANLINVPITRSFTLKNLRPHLQPQKIKRIKEDHGPFLFTPINFGSLERKNTHTLKNKVDYLWVEGDICEVSLQLINPLNFELNVSNIRLLTKGLIFESIPESITLPAECGPIAITLVGTPKETGDLEILGFTTHTLGVKSNCRLKNMNGMSHTQYCVEVIPVLPKIDISTSLPQTASFSCGENIVTSASISLYGGESAECTITIKNIGQVAIEMIDISFISALESHIQSKIFKWSDENIKTQLPLPPEATASITLYLYAHMEFIALTKHITNDTKPVHHSNNLIEHNGHNKYLPSRLQSPSHQSRQLKNSMTTQVPNTSINFPTSHTRLSKLAPPLAASNTIDGQLKIKYSGRAGLVAGYCRVSSVFITIEILPSVKITKWDVLPAETPSQFYLVLDLINMTHQEMELHYTQTKWIYMGSKESCRVPVPVNRCPLNKLLQVNKIGTISELQMICAQHIISRVDLKWQLLSTNISGKATLFGIFFEQDMLDIVRMSPLDWEVTINNTAVKPQDEITCGLGDCVNIGVTVYNALEQPLTNLNLSINFYQDYHNGVNNYRLDTRLSIAGANKITLPTGYGRAYHECRVVFFTAGQYKLDIQCSSRQSTLSLNNIDLNFVPDGHIWRYIPPIEIVIENC